MLRTVRAAAAAAAAAMVTLVVLVVNMVVEAHVTTPSQDETNYPFYTISQAS